MLDRDVDIGDNVTVTLLTNLVWSCRPDQVRAQSYSSISEIL